MRKRKPFIILEERRKCHYIEIALYKRRKIFSFSLSTSIGISGVGLPDIGEYPSLFKAKNAALNYVLTYHQSEYEKVILKKFRLMKDIDQPLLFYD